MEANTFNFSDSNSLPISWQKILGTEFEKDYMKELQQFLFSEISQNKTIYPQGDEIFSALKFTPYQKVSVVIIGQDPYHGEGQAHGLSFSVKPGIKPPPSLKNIFQELQSDLGITPSAHGYLKSWADQGVLLLNAVLTVEKDLANSHRGKGWETFTDTIIEILNERPEPIVFLLWGSPAQKKAQYLDSKKHFILKAPHPSPLSAYRGFLGCRHFSKTNQILQELNLPQINWSLPQN